MISDKVFSAFKEDFLDVCGAHASVIPELNNETLETVLSALEDGALLGSFFRSHPYGENEDERKSLVERLYSQVETVRNANFDACLSDFETDFLCWCSGTAPAGENREAFLERALRILADESGWIEDVPMSNFGEDAECLLNALYARLDTELRELRKARDEL